MNSPEEDKGLGFEMAKADGNDITEGENVKYQLQRKLKARHIQMIAIGSNIGTGLFIGTGKGLHTGGPLSLVIGFVLMSAVLTIMMQCLTEMSVVFPVSGSFAQYATRFVDRSLGFAVGWQYWLCWLAVFGAESSAFVILINYWNDDPRFTPLWISIFILLNLCIHFAPVWLFGEVEFVVSSLKIIAVVVFLVVIWVIMGGGGPNGHTYGAEYWHQSGLVNGVANGFYGFGSVFVTCAFACGGTEMVGLVVGEAQHPRYNLPRAIRLLMWRIFLFYVLSSLFLTFVVPYDNDSLLGGSNANSSPFVIAIQSAGIKYLPDILNAVVMVCVVSVGSTSIYISSRVLRGLAEEGFAPKWLIRTDRRGRPYTALLVSGACGVILAYLNCSSTGAIIFNWFSSITGLTFFFAWLTIIACNWRFHAAIKAQGVDILEQTFQFRATGWPWLPLAAFLLVVFMIVCQFAISVHPIGIKASAEIFFANFLGGPTFFAFWAVHKLICRTGMVPLKDIDLRSGLHTDDPEENAKLERYHSLSKRERILTYFRF